MSVVLAIGGSDSSAGAGVWRDLHTLAQLHTPGVCAITAVTAQTDAQVRAVHHVPCEIVREQITAALAAHAVGAVKIGMLGSAACVATVAGALRRCAAPIVLDPVLNASSGGALLDDAGRRAVLEALLPRAAVLTPNVLELAALLDETPCTDDAGLIAQARRLIRYGASAVLVKGGHASGAECVDLLLVDAEAHALRFSSPRLPVALRGTGCALASALAAGLACGLDLPTACNGAKAYIETRFRSTQFVGPASERTVSAPSQPPPKAL